MCSEVRGMERKDLSSLGGGVQNKETVLNASEGVSTQNTKYQKIRCIYIKGKLLLEIEGEKEANQSY